MTRDEISALLKGVTVYNWTSGTATTRDDSADPFFFYGVRSIGDVMRSIRAEPATAPGTSSAPVRKMSPIKAIQKK